jgi:hypothetical protein
MVVAVFIHCDVKTAEKLEARLHKRFSAKSVRGEWFRLTPQDLKEISSMGEGSNISDALQTLFERGYPDVPKFSEPITKNDSGTVIGIIRDESANGARVPSNLIISRSVELGLTEAKAKKILSDLKGMGDIYEPAPGDFKIL